MISHSSELLIPVLGLINYRCEVPVWVILLAVLFVLCLAAFLLSVSCNCKKAMAEYNMARTQADIDELTGLLSRHGITRALQKGQCQHGANGQCWSVIFMDINGLKSINDVNGHLVGDYMLKVFAQSLASAIRFSDHAGRWGGDEFIVLVSGIRSNTDIMALCNKLQRETSKTITVNEKEVKISASFGYALATVDGKDTKDLIRVADERMYKSKQRNAVKAHSM